MVYRKRSRRPRRRNPIARRRRNYRRRQRWNKKRHVKPSLRTLTTFPDRMRMKMKLFDYGTWMIQGSQAINFPRSTSNGLGTTSYSTSCWKPIAFSNHYQHYTEEIAQIYNKYRVLGVKYRLRCYTTQINQTTWVGIVKDIGVLTSSGQTWNQMMEDPRTHFKSMGSVNSGRATCVLSGYLDVAKTFGKTVGAVQDDDEFNATFGADPTRRAYINPIIMTTWPEATDPPTGQAIDYEMWLTYYVQMEDRIMALSVN